VKGLRSAVNKEYLNGRFLQKDGDLDYFGLKSTNIKISEPYYDGLYGDNDLVSKKYVDEQNGNQDIAMNDKLPNDGSHRMNADPDMNNRTIVNVRDPTNRDGDAINYHIFHEIRGSLKRQIDGVSVQADDVLHLNKGKNWKT